MKVQNGPQESCYLTDVANKGCMEQHFRLIRNCMLLACYASCVVVVSQISAQERPSSGCANENGCIHGGYYDFEHEDEGAVAVAGGSGARRGGGNGLGTGAGGTTTGGGLAGPGGGEPGVEPERSPGPIVPFLASFFPGPNRGGTRMFDPRALQPLPKPFTSPSLLQLSPFQASTVSISPYYASPAAYKEWIRSDLGTYVDTLTLTREKARVWASSSDSANTSVPASIFGTSSLEVAREEVPTRITQAQNKISAASPPVFVPLSDLTVDSSRLPGPPENHEEVSEKTYEWSKKAIEIGTERALESLDRDLEQVRVGLAKNTISQKQFDAYVKGVSDTRSVVSGLGKLLTAADYAVAVKKIFIADPGKNTQYYAEKLAYQLAIDLGGKAAQKGISTVSVALLPKLAPYLSGPAGIAITSGQIVFGSEEIGKDPAEVVRDNSGRYSIEEKRKAFGQELKWYDKRGPDAISSDDLLRQMQIIVEEEKKLPPK